MFFFPGLELSTEKNLKGKNEKPAYNLNTGLWG